MNFSSPFKQRAAFAVAFFLASASAAWADCAALLDRFNDALGRRAIDEVKTLESEIARDAVCGGRLVEVRRRRVALQLVFAQKMIDKGSPTSSYENLVVEADRPQVHWLAAKLLGDIRFSQRRFGDASRAYERALEIIKNPSRTPSDPQIQVIEEVFDLATRSRVMAANDEGSGASPVFVPVARDYRDGSFGGTFSEDLRGFRPKKVPLPIMFHTAKTAFTEVGTAAANELLAAVREQRPQKIAIVGHTDERGSYDYNMRLSAARAAAVFQFLRDNGVAAPIITVAKGKTEPIFLSNTAGLTQEDIWALNRRVEWQRD